jgi:hypothetical protein
MSGFRVREAGIKQLFSARGEVATWNRGVARGVQREIKKRTPVDTGRLRASWRLKHFAAGGSLRLVSTIYTDVNYVNYVIRGRGPVVPVRRQFLRFRGRGGNWVYAKRVRGVPPNDFVQNGLMAGAGATHRIKLRVPR